MSNQKKFDVIVVGAGLIGAAFALKLANSSDYRILVVERSVRLTDSDSPNQRVLALGNVATTLLKETGVFERCQLANCYPYSRMFVWDEASAGELEFCADDYQSESLGYMVDAHYLTQQLQQALFENKQITVNFEQQIESLELTQDVATLKESSINSFSAPLIVAADGIHSWCRQQAKIFVNRTDYNQQGIVARIQSKQPHLDTAWQIFLNSGPLGLLPLSENQCSIVWSANNDRAEQLLGLPDEDFAAEMSFVLENRFGEIELLSQRQAFPLTSMKAEKYYKHRLVLIGDAAHSIHPLAGQGANLGFKDIATLVEQLVKVSDASMLGDIDVLARYQASRKGDNEQTDLIMNALHSAYQNDTAWWAALRGAGMNWVSRSEGIKSLLAQQAMG